MKHDKKAPSGGSTHSLLARADKALAAHRRKMGEPPRLPQDQHEAFLRNQRRTRTR